MDLNDLRNEIDMIDKEIMSLLNKRFDIVEKVKVYKKINHLEVLDTSRENKIYDKIEQLDSKYESNIKEIYSCIMDQSKNNQRKDD